LRVAEIVQLYDQHRELWFDGRVDEFVGLVSSIIDCFLVGFFFQVSFVELGLRISNICSPTPGIFLCQA